MTKVVPSNSIHESERLAALHRYPFLHRSHFSSLDRITALASRTFQVPIAAISLVDEADIEFLSTHGFDPHPIPRSPGFCASAILQPDVFVIRDTRKVATTRTHPFVKALKLRFYAAAPLITQDGQILGTVWIGDGQPRQITEEEVATLQDLATIVMNELELRRLNHQLSTDLEHQVQERTSQLQQALEFESVLKRITDKVRDSFDENQILQSAVEELGSVLNVACCNAALYDLEHGTSVIRYEHATGVPGSWGRVSQMVNSPEIYSQLLAGHHFQFCSVTPSPVRGRVSMLACPILLGVGVGMTTPQSGVSLSHEDAGVLGDLWLVNPSDSCFQDVEIRLVQQVANQCAIAIRQARLYKAAQAQVAELEKLNHLKDTFLSTVSHELRTPMSNMKMAIHMLRNLPDPNRMHNYLDILQAECTREIELINDLLDLQQLESGSYSVLPDTVQMEEWVPLLLEPFYARTQQWRQTLQVHLPQALPTFLIDRTILGRVLTELLKNACKYTPVEGQITFSLSYDEVTSEMVTVIRNQAEIPSTELSRIFEKFYRIPRSDPWRQGGTGLGLALVQKLVEQLHGQIAAWSQEGWTAFTVRVPVQSVSVRSQRSAFSPTLSLTKG